jgi:hypothetical protein
MQGDDDTGRGAEPLGFFGFRVLAGACAGSPEKTAGNLDAVVLVSIERVGDKIS